MRIRAFCAAALSLAAVPALAQSRDVTGPWTLRPEMVTCTDLPVAVKPVPRMAVKGPHNLDQLIGMVPGSELIVARSAGDGLAAGQRYFTARIYGDKKRFPRPGEGFGDVRVTGIVTVRAVDEINAVAHVDVACDSIEIGDFLEPFVEVILPASASHADAPPDFADRGAVLFGSDSRTAVGRGYITSVDRGTLHGVTAGARFALYRDKRNGLPLVYLGEAVVLAVSEQTSKVMITKSNGAVESGDVAVPRRQP